MRFLPKKKALGIAFIFFAIPLFVTATHFRFGLMTATRISETATTVTYRLDVSTSWRLGTGANPFFTISGGNSGSTNIIQTFTTDPSGLWTNGSGSTTITLNKTSTLTRIGWSSCCKISTLSNNSDQSWDVFIILNTANPGSSPVSSLPAIINMPVNAAAATYTIPVSDPDPGSYFTFGTPFSTSSALSFQSNPSGFSLNSSTGQITFNTVGKSIGQLYNAMATVKDNDGNQILLDFIIQMVGASNPPQFDYNVMPTNGFVYNVIAGQNITFPVKATDADAGSSVSLSVSGLPTYITTSNFSPALPAMGNPSQTYFSWTPNSSHIGNTVVLNFIATDNVGVQTTTSVTLKVVAEPAPDFVSPTPSEATIRQIIPGTLYQDVIKVESSLSSNISIAFANTPTGSTLSPTIPTPAAHPATTTLSWTPTPINWGLHNLSYQAVISSVPTIFSTRSYKLIVNTPPNFTSSPITSVNAGETYTYSITVIDPDLPYGDQLDIISSSLPSWLTLTDNGNGTATLFGSPTVADAGYYPIHIEAEDIYHLGNPSTVDQLFTIQVVACNTNIATKDITVSLDVNGNASIDASEVDNGSTADCGISSLTVQPSSFTCVNIGPNTVTLTLTNNVGIEFVATAIVTITNTAPAITSVMAPVDPVPINTSINLNVNYTDNNVTKAEINWGDGTAVQTVLNPTTSFTTPHTYTSAGVYTVKVNLTDACNVQGTEYVYQYVVIYDPSAGFVTGGGWINSPAGAYTADPLLTGKANFGFVSKYEKGKSVPSGSTQFQFHAADMNFKSTNYEWLVISGSKAQFKGVGSINDAGNYGFLLSAVDGNLNSPQTPDRFRIKIWDRVTSAIIYDNQIGEADDALASTDIGGGSIVVHAGKAPRSSANTNLITGNMQEQIIANKFLINALPNPSFNHFTLILKSDNQQPISVRMMDVLGRVIESKQNINANTTFTIGENYRPGVYFMEVMQGKERQILRLVKIAD